MKALITGATSGIGHATALLFAKEGIDVLVAGRRVERLRELESQKLKGRLIAGELDLTKKQSISDFVKRNDDFLNDIDIVVNNAGLAIGKEKFFESNMDEVETVLQTNIIGLLSLTRAVLPTMIRKKSGHIVNMGSIAGRHAYMGGTVYCATKAAVHMITETLRMDLGGTGVRVTTIGPGRVATEFSEVRFRGNKEAAKKVYEGFRPLSPEDVSETILWTVQRPSHVNIQELIIMPTDQPDITSIVPKT